MIIIFPLKIRFIINPISGTGKQKGIEKYITKHLENSEIIYKSARDGEIICSIANITKSQKELGFYRKISLDVGLNTL